MRLVHAADLHLDSPLRSVAMRDETLGAELVTASRTVLRRIVDLCLAEQVDALVLAGDVFDGDQPDLAARLQLTQELARLARGGVPTVLIRGNHDALMDHGAFGSLGDDVHLLDAERPSVRIGDAAFHGLSFETRHQRESALPRYPGPDPRARVNVGLMHTSLDGSPDHDPYGPCAASELMTHGYDYWALGHIHRRTETRRDGCAAVMPGIPQGRSPRETGRGSVTLATFGDALEVEMRPVALLSFEEATVDLAGAASDRDRVEAVEAALTEAARDDHAVALRLTLTGEGAAAWADDTSTRVRAVAQTHEGVHVDSVRLGDLGPVRDNPLGDDLRRLMAEEGAKSGFREAAKTDLKALRGALPADLREAFDALTAEEVLDARLAEGIADVMARIRGA